LVLLSKVGRVAWIGYLNQMQALLHGQELHGQELDGQ